MNVNSLDDLYEQITFTFDNLESEGIDHIELSELCIFALHNKNPKYIGDIKPNNFFQVISLMGGKKIYGEYKGIKYTHGENLDYFVPMEVFVQE